MIENLVINYYQKIFKKKLIPSVLCRERLFLCLQTNILSYVSLPIFITLPGILVKFFVKNAIRCLFMLIIDDTFINVILSFILHTYLILNLVVFTLQLIIFLFLLFLFLINLSILIWKALRKSIKFLHILIHVFNLILILNTQVTSKPFCTNFPSQRFHIKPTQLVLLILLRL